MTRINLELTPEEIKVLTSLAADQLFRREFIDPKMPGYKPNTGELAMGKALLERLRALSSERQPAAVRGQGQRRAV
jgi:hypothetical protein